MRLTMFQKVVHSSAILLLLVSARPSVNGLVSEGDVAEKSVSVTPVLSERGQDIGDAVKKINVSSSDVRTVTRDDKIDPIQDQPLNDQHSTVLYNSTVSLDEKKKPDEENHPQQNVATNETLSNSTTSSTVATTKVQDDPGDTENPAGTGSEETTLTTEPTTENLKNSTDTASSSSSSSTLTTSSESVSESTSKSTTSSTTETTVTTEMVTVTLPEESSTSEKTTQEPKMEPTESKDPGMSSGIIALVMAIVFAVIVIIVYVGLLLWRRYLEFRYGNRELLVNDLEFDTNDLRHFEL